MNKTLLALLLVFGSTFVAPVGADEPSGWQIVKCSPAFPVVSISKPFVALYSASTELTLLRSKLWDMVIKNGQSNLRVKSFEQLNAEMEDRIFNFFGGLCDPYHSEVKDLSHQEVEYIQSFPRPPLTIDDVFGVK